MTMRPGCEPPPTQHLRAAAPVVGHARRGLTFIETVAAVALLSLVAGMLYGALGFVMRAQHRNERMLAAAELANRLLLQYLDDPTELPNPAQPVADRDESLQGPAELFRWSLQESPVDYELDDASERLGLENPFRNVRHVHVTVRVWLSEYSEGSRQWETSPVRFELSRLVDPLAFRTPDQFERLWEDPERMRQFLEGIPTSTVPTGGTRRR